MAEKILQLYGIDPGLVDTGLVGLRFNTEARQIGVRHTIINGAGRTSFDIYTAVWSRMLESPASTSGTNGIQHSVFVEKYRERGTSYTEHAAMRELTSKLGTDLRDAKLVDNTGSKQVVKPALLELLGIRTFPTTHHQDLQAAARILVYGMLKATVLNGLLTDVVLDHLAGNSWEVLHP